MKKLTLGLALLLSSITTQSFAAVSAGESPVSVCIPSLCGGFNIGITGYWWRPSTAHMDYALTYPGFFPDTIVPINLFGPFDIILSNGHHSSVDHDYDWGYKINVGYVFPCTGNDVTIAFTHFDHDDNDHVDRNGGVILPTLFGQTLNGIILFPAVEGVVDFVFGLTPPFVDIGLFDIFAYFNDGYGIGGVPVDRASAWSDFKYEAWDLEFAQYVSVGCELRMRWFASLRWANLEHRFNVDYSGALLNVNVTDAIAFAAGDIGTGALSMDAAVHIRTKSNFEGVGPRIGLNANYYIGIGFGLLGEVSGALLIGEINSHFREDIHRMATLTEIVSGDGGVTFLTDSESVLFDDAVAFHHPNETRIVPNLEGKLGIDYSWVFCNPCRSKLTLEAGYMVTYYFNVVDHVSSVGLDTPEFRSRHTNDADFDGLYIAIQFQF